MSGNNTVTISYMITGSFAMFDSFPVDTSSGLLFLLPSGR